MQKLLSILTKNKGKIFNILKWFTVPLVFGVLYYQLVVKSDFENAVELFSKGMTLERIPYLLLVLGLMPINLGTEALKWKILLEKTHNINYKESYQSVFAGIALSIFTPKRVGEYAGRLLLLKGNRMSAAGSLFVGNFSQMIANLVLGLFATVLFFRNYDVQYERAPWLIPVSVVLSVVLLFTYLNLDKVIIFFNRFSFFTNFSDKINVISTYSQQTLFTFLALSIVKYIVFVFQFVLLLYAFGISLKLFWAIIAAGCVFFIKTMLPVPASVELAARGSIAIYFFSYFTENHIGILVASIVLWVVNLALPAIIGSYFISKKKI